MEEKIITDYTISVGFACRPAHYLREYGLRRCSNPLDWMMLYSLQDVVELFRTDFSTFFVKKAEHLQKSVGKFRYVEDLQNGMISMHSFPLDLGIDEAFGQFSETMAKRYLRMKKCMESSEHVLFVSNRDDSCESFEVFLKEMRRLFACRMTCLNIRWAKDFQSSSTEIAPGLEYIEVGFQDFHPNGHTPENPEFWKGNPVGWGKVMQKIELSQRFAHLDFAKFEDKVQK